MPRSTVAVYICLLLLAISSAVGQQRRKASVLKLSAESPIDVHVSTSSGLTDTCIVSSIDQMNYQVSGWIQGGELYKAYLDPSEVETGCYPFEVHEISMVMYFEAGARFTVSVDLEAIDIATLPGYQLPGEILSVSSDWRVVIPPEGGLYNIWIPLDTPLVVNEPVFAGFYIATPIAEYSGAALVTDAEPKMCQSFCVWDEEIGWLDLTQNQYRSFAGNIAMSILGAPLRQRTNEVVAVENGSDE